MIEQDWSKYTLDQLQQKQDQVLLRLGAATAMGSGATDGLLRVLNSIETAMMDRIRREEIQTYIDNSPCIIETDPDLAKLNKQKDVKVDDGLAIRDEPRTTKTRRSAKPLNPSDLN